MTLIAVQDILIIFKRFSSQDILIRNFGEDYSVLVELKSEKVRNIRKGQKRSQNLSKYLYRTLIRARTIIEQELISLQDAY